MSIITDALKKAELEKQKRIDAIRIAETFSPVDKEEISKSFKEPQEYRKSGPSPDKSDSKTKFWILAGVIGIVIVGGFVFIGDLLGRQRSVIIIPNLLGSRSDSKTQQGGIELSLNMNPSSVSFSKETSTALQHQNSKPKKQSASQQLGPAKSGLDILGLGASGFILSGIVYDPVKPTAIINNEIVEVGETISQAQVVEITELDVTLEQNGRKFKLTM